MTNKEASRISTKQHWGDIQQIYKAVKRHRGGREDWQQFCSVSSSLMTSKSGSMSSMLESGSYANHTSFTSDIPKPRCLACRWVLTKYLPLSLFSFLIHRHFIVSMKYLPEFYTSLLHITSGYESSLPIDQNSARTHYTQPYFDFTNWKQIHCYRYCNHPKGHLLQQI